MIHISETEFNKEVSKAIDSVPEKYQKRLQNVAFIVEDEPSNEQRELLKLKPYQTLFGLYEGVPLPQRGGASTLLPDKITIFKNPIMAVSKSKKDMREIISNTIWHEVAHYFGLDHEKISELENK